MPADLDTVHLARAIQTAIGPVVLISGVGLLLLTMTNRLGRVVDRARQLAQLLGSPDVDRALVEAQLDVLAQRARLVRSAVTMASLCVLLVAVLIAVLFLSPLFGVDLTVAASVLFAASMAALIASLVAFIRDVYVSLVALELEVAAARRGAPRRDP